MNAFTRTRSPTVMAPVDHADGRPPHDERDRDGDDRALRDVEQRQRSLALHRGGLPALHALVVASRLELLVAEVLDGLVIEQAVDRAGVRLRVEVVHLAAEIGSPLGDRHGGDDVERQRRQRDRDERPVVAGGEDRRDEADLDQRRQDREQRVADQGRDAPRAALDVPRQATGLPRQVETQAERVQVAGTPRARSSRTARWVTLANRNSRSSVKSVVESRNTP